MVRRYSWLLGDKELVQEKQLWVFWENLGGIEGCFLDNWFLIGDNESVMKYVINFIREGGSFL